MVLATVLLLSGCTTGTAARGLLRVSPSAPTVRVTTGAISFAYPAGWSRKAWPGASSFTYLAAAVSNQQLMDPCFKRGRTSGCGQPISRLGAGALLAEWWEDGFPSWSLAKQPGSPIQADGLQGKVQQLGADQGDCLGLGADSSLHVVVLSPTAGNYFQFVACMKAPGITQVPGEAMAILKSSRFLTA